MSFLDDYDSSTPGPFYWVCFGIISLSAAIDFLDFFIVGFLVAVLGPQWHLTYGQSALMLLSAGLGTILGSLLFGALADLFGRKPLIVVASVLAGLASAAIAIIPDGSWVLFTGLRFVVGVAVGGVATSSCTLAVELSPTRLRTILSSLNAVFPTVGILLASLIAALVLGRFGWRGLALVGSAPLFVGILVALVVPESPRWQVSKGAFDAARRTLERLRRAGSAPLGTTPPILIAKAKVGLSELYTIPARFWLVVLIWIGMATAEWGIYLWGPTILALKGNIAVAQAAAIFVLVSLSGIVGKIVFSFLPHYIGRRRVGQICGFAACLTLAAAGFWQDASIGTLSVFLVLLVAAAFFLDGSFANMAPYPAEIYPIRLAARATGLGQASSGIGKIVGPLSLAMIAGADNLVAPKATTGAILPGFLLLSAFALLAALAFTLVPIEPNGRAMRFDDEPEGARPTPLGEANPV